MRARDLLGGALTAAGFIGILWSSPFLLSPSDPLLQAHFLFAIIVFLVMLVLGAFMLAMEGDVKA